MVALLHLQAKYIYSFNLLWFDIWLISSSLFSMQEMHLNYYYMWKHYIKVALRSIYTKKMSSRDNYHQLTTICSDCMYCEVLEKPLLHCVSASSSLIFLCDIKKRMGEIHLVSPQIWTPFAIRANAELLSSLFGTLIWRHWHWVHPVPPYCNYYPSYSFSFHFILFYCAFYFTSLYLY